MKINDEEASPDNTMIFTYFENDMMDGFFVDLGENYMFMSAHTPGYDMIADALEQEGVTTVNFLNYDIDEEPHRWVAESLGMLVVDEAEEILEENSD